MTAVAIAPGRRAAVYNPSTQRHTWVKDAEHHKTCGHCALHVENREIEGVGRWFQVWTWPADGRGFPDGHNRRGGGVPKCPGPPVAAAGEPSAAGLTCRRCGDELLAVVPTFHGLDVGIVARDPAGDLVVVQRGEQWFVRRVAGDEEVDPDRRRRGHWCIYRYRCLGKAGTCGLRGRLYAVGTFCDGCTPRPMSLVAA